MQWVLAAKHDPDDRLIRQQSNVFVKVNHGGEVLDFHRLHHAYGVWLAKIEVHPKTFQTVMCHSTTTLTMDRYGHSFPDQVGEATGKE